MLPIETVAIENDQQLLACVRQYQRIRTYPSASDRYQVDLHRRLEALAARGLVREVSRDGSSIVWAMEHVGRG